MTIGGEGAGRSGSSRLCSNPPVSHLCLSREPPASGIKPMRRCGSFATRGVMPCRKMLPIVTAAAAAVPRLPGSRFPHDRRAFGYPLTDVVGFIENQGRNFTRCGCWKLPWRPRCRCTSFCPVGLGRTRGICACSTRVLIFRLPCCRLDVILYQYSLFILAPTEQTTSGGKKSSFDIAVVLP